MNFKKFCSEVNDNRNAPERLKRMTERLIWPEAFKNKPFPKDEELGKIITAIKYKLAYKDMLAEGREATEKFSKNYSNAIKFEKVSDIISLYEKGFNTKSEKGENNMGMKIVIGKKSIDAKSLASTVKAKEIKTVSKEKKTTAKGEKKERKVNTESIGYIICKVLSTSKESNEVLADKMSKQLKNKCINPAYIAWYRSKMKKFGTFKGFKLPK